MERGKKTQDSGSKNTWKIRVAIKSQKKKKKVSEGPRIKMSLSLRRVNSKHYGFWCIRVTPSPFSPMFQSYYEFQKDLQKPRVQGLMSYLALMMEHSK